MNDYELWLVSAPISCRLKVKLISEYKTAENLWCEVINFRPSESLQTKTIRKLFSSWNDAVIKNLKECISVKKINIVTYFQENYPSRLRRIEDAPYALFYYGDIKALNRVATVSIVGSRKCSHYGMDVTSFIAKELALNKVSIVSGMARGIDTIAHKASIENNGYTCAVLGSGLDVVYPKENMVLFKNICNTGCVISELLPGTPPLAYNFPIRNRIVSALSDLVVVVEAGYKSGSLITANSALEQGKDVVAVPGSIFSEQSKGTNRLIRDGAYPFTSMEDIFSILKIEGTSRALNEVKVTAKHTKLQGEICSLLCNNPIHIDDIIRITNIDIQLLYEVLFEMQLRNEIRCLSGSYYVKVNDSI